MIDHATVKGTLRDALLRLLSDLQWHPHYELAERSGVRYGARVLELRRLGYVIETVNMGADSCGNEYRLLSRTPGKPQGKRVQVYLEEADAAMLTAGTINATVHTIVADALASFRARKTML